MAPERITGQSYTITSDVWSLGVTLLEVAQHRFPFPADGTEMQPKAGLIDLLTYIVRQPIPKLKDERGTEQELGIKWSENFKYFIECWYVLNISPSPLSSVVNQLINKTTVSKKNPPAAPRPGACSNTPGWSRCRAKKSTCSTFWLKCGIGKIE